MELNDKNSFWVARDKSGELCLFTKFPYKMAKDDSEWHCDDQTIYLPSELFPDLTWDDLPEEIKISFKNPIYKMTCPYCGKEITYHLSDVKQSCDYQPSSDYSDEWNYIVCPHCKKEIKIS